jgi:hypothetical protein
MARPLATRIRGFSARGIGPADFDRLDNLTRPVSFAYFRGKRGGRCPIKERRASCM